MTKRTARQFSLPTGDYDALVQAIEDDRNRPIVKASRKLFDFVNSAVTDTDFRHPDCRHLLHFLLLVRDELTDGISEDWDIDDIFAPMVTALSRYRGKAAKGRPKPNRKTPLRRGLEMLVAEGLTNDEILAELGNDVAVSRRVDDGFPFSVDEPESSSVRSDGRLVYFEIGSNEAKPITVAELQKLLSRIRSSHKAA